MISNNAYQMLLEQAGFKVSRMYVQAICRDASLRIAAKRGIDKPRLHHSDKQNQRPLAHALLSTQGKTFAEAISTNTLPPVCSFRERWNDKKCLSYCLSYCAARENCPYAQKLNDVKTGYEKSRSRSRNIRFIITKDGENNCKDFMTNMSNGGQMVFPFGAFLLIEKTYVRVIESGG